MIKVLSMFLLCAGLALAVNSAEAQHFVKAHPAARVVVRPAAPSPRHVWVDDEWSWKGGAYVQVPGHWILPPHGRKAWVPGHWVTKHGHGDYWVAGHWS
jgi:hypothetical protein